MNDYIYGYNAAWEEAFDRRSADGGKAVGQFCCNNGRETLPTFHE